MKNHGQKFGIDGIIRRFAVRKIIFRKELFGFSKKLQFVLGLSLPPHWPRRLARNVAIGLVILFAFGAVRLVDRGQGAAKQILGAATSGFDFLEESQADLLRQDFGAAAATSAAATDLFAKAKDQALAGTGLLSPLLALLPQGQDLNNALDAGAHGSAALGKLAAALADFQKIRPALDDQTLYLGLRRNSAALQESYDELTAAEAALVEINPLAVPDNYREKFLQGGRKIVAAKTALGELLRFQNMILRLLGGRDKAYLLVFQNNNEARATGGFMGTYGILKFQNGAMRIDRIESIYALDGQLQRQIAPPRPMLRTLTTSWGIRDSNWFADFPASARKMLGFLEEEAGITADGVISFTPDVFERLLVLTGPIDMPEYGTTLTAENFRATVQAQTSLLYDRQLNQPKKFLADFTPRFLQKLTTLDDGGWLRFLDVLLAAAQEKHVLMFSLDSGIEDFLKTTLAGGEIRSAPGDYLAIIHSNLGGGKTDLGISQKVEKNVVVDETGRAVATLRITRSHAGYDEKFLPRNLDFMRILVPEGSRLLSASGFDDNVLADGPAPRSAAADRDVALWEEALVRDEANKMYIGRESGHTFFANWQTLLPGETKVVTLTYVLPERVDGQYSFLLQKQAGARPFDFDFTLRLPPARQIVFSSPAEFKTATPGMARIAEAVSTDRFYAAVSK